MQAKREKPDPATFLGSGKIEELGILAKEAEVDVVVFDIALSAAQERNIERLIGIPVLDRTELILDIFRQRAKSREGRLQVELARLEHLSTRLVRGWTHLERQRGGLGKTGGPGEKQIELDRRMIGTRMKQLRDQLKRLARQRARSAVPVRAAIRSPYRSRAIRMPASRRFSIRSRVQKRTQPISFSPRWIQRRESSGSPMRKLWWRPTLSVLSAVCRIS